LTLKKRALLLCYITGNSEIERFQSLAWGHTAEKAWIPAQVSWSLNPVCSLLSSCFMPHPGHSCSAVSTHGSCGGGARHGGREHVHRHASPVLHSFALPKPHKAARGYLHCTLTLKTWKVKSRKDK
jgi:hypothetical protein